MDNTEKFLIITAISNSVIAGLSTRNKKFPIYSEGINDEFRKVLNHKITQNLWNLYFEVKGSEISDLKKLTTYWRQLKDEIEAIEKNKLYNGIFRLGVSQKIINLYLKYLCCFKIIKKFDFCPIDGFVKARLNTSLKNWTETDKETDLLEYYDAINAIKSNKYLSIAEWELDIWNQSKPN